MVPFRLAVLGPTSLRSPDGEVIRFRTRKQFALLVYLTIESRMAHRRERLSSVFWPRYRSADARHSLAESLSGLKHRIGPEAFATDRETIRVLPGHIITDLDLLAHDDPRDPDTAPAGPFLEDFELDDLPDFQAWKDAERSRVVPLIQRVMEHRLNYCRRRGDSMQMEELARRLLRVDKLNELAVRAQVEARTLAGDRIGALRVIDDWCTRLADELGATPSDSMTRMADRLRRNSWDRPGMIAPEPASPEQVAQQPFVGRVSEFAACYDVWTDARSGTPRHLLIRGDSGIGKTTLVERIAAAAAIEDAAIARVKCYELERELPFGVVGAIVNHLLDFPGAAATPPDQLAEVGGLVSKVRQRYPGLPAPAPSTSENARILFTEGVLAIIAAVAEERPVVLAVDDIHLADATSLAVIHLILRRIERLPVMFLLTSSIAVDQELPNARRFVDSAEAIGLTQLSLGPLMEKELSELLDRLLEHRAAPGVALRRTLLNGAQGNPMILKLLVEDWHRRGDDCVAASLSSMQANARPPLEDTFRRLVVRSLDALDPESRRVAELGAILGQRLNDISMYTLVDLPAARALRAMASLASHQILRDAGRTLEFTNELVRGQCYVSTPGPVRRMLHGSVADRLLAEDGGASPIPGLEIAWHMVRADRLVEAVPYLLAGGREAIHRAAPDEADLALSTGLPALTGEARRTAILLLAEAQQELGRWLDSLQLLDCSREPFSAEEQELREVHQIVAGRWLGHFSMESLVAATDRLLAIGGGLAKTETRMKALTAAIRLLGLTRRADQLSTLETVLATLDTLAHEPYVELHAVLVRGWILASRHGTQQALTELRAGLVLAEKTAISSSITVRMLIGEGNLLGMSGRYEDALDPLGRAAQLTVKLDNTTLRGECACQLAVMHGKLGNVTQMIGFAQEALDSFGPYEWSAAVITARYELGLGLVADGRNAEAQAAVTPLSQWKWGTIPDWAVQAALLCEADVLALSGSAKRAYSVARRATNGAGFILHHVAYAGQYARWVTLLGCKDGRVAEAHKRLSTEFPTVDHLDKRDEAEVLASFSLLKRVRGNRDKRLWRRVEQRLGKLPPTVTAFLRRLGEETVPFGPVGSPLGPRKG